MGTLVIKPIGWSGVSLEIMLPATRSKAPCSCWFEAGWSTMTTVWSIRYNLKFILRGISWFRVGYLICMKVRNIFIQ